MGNVHVLPPELVSKIAAGEVIERPASVIKEVVENSIDAGTKSLEIHLRQAGKTLISVKDTGGGIAGDDMEKIFLRHSTSKIVKLSDLFDIHSLGFRGEALYSIAAISDVILRSRTAAEDSGWEIHLRGGERIGLKPCPMNVGAEIEVKELFYNTPARRKFLKSNTTEMNQILNILIPYALLYPSLRFLVTHEDKTILDLKPTDDTKERIANTLNLDAQHLLATNHKLPEEEISLDLILGDINIARSRRDMQFIFVNGRPVQSKSINFHVNNVYRLILPQGQYPFFAISLQIPGSEVDANIHPTKREVKIRDEQNLCTIIREMCENTLMTAGQAKQATAHLPPTPGDLAIHRAMAGATVLDSDFGGDAPSEIFDAVQTAFNRQPTTEQYSFPEVSHLTYEEEALLRQKQTSLQTKLTRGRYVGSFLNKYTFFEADNSLLVIDQHAAQERITFEQLVLQMKKGQMEIQHLLSPFLIKLTPQEILIWEDAKDKFEQFGFSTTMFDKETVAVHTYPVLLKDPVKAVRDILSGDNPARCDHETIARRACRASVMAGDVMNAEKAEGQRQLLLRCRDPFTCPHGRPTLIEMTEDYLDKQFLRG
jgi:DNA mismatch repair protein MutL